MIWGLIRRNLATRGLWRWWGVCGISMALVQGMRVLRFHERIADLAPEESVWLTAAVIILPILPFLINAGSVQRYSPMEAALPLPTRRLWIAHVVALLLEGLAILAVLIGLLIGMDSVWAGRTEAGLMPSTAGLLPMVTHTAATVILAITLLCMIRPARMRLATTGKGHALMIGLLVAYSIGMIFLALLPIIFALILLLLSALLLWQTYGRLGAAIDFVFPRGAVGPSGDQVEEHGWSEAALSPRGGNPTRFVLNAIWRSLMHRYLAWFLYIILAFYGFMLSGGLAILGSSWDSRLGMIPMTWYLLLLILPVGLKKCDLLDAFPIPRRRIFAILALPAAACVLAGYAGGHILGVLKEEPTDKLIYSEQECCHSLQLDLKYFEIDWDGVPPPVTSPWGEVHSARRIPVFRGLPPVIYKPYSAADSCSLEFLAYQVSRAAERVYGLQVDPYEIATRYFERTDGDSIRLKGEGLTLVEDYAPPRPSRLERLFPPLFDSSQGGLFPMIAFLVGVPWLLLMALGAQIYRASISHVRRKWYLVALLGGVLAAHVGTFGFAVADVAEPHIVTAFILILSGKIASALPGGAFSMYILSALFVWTSYAFAQRRFERVEIPVQRSPLRYMLGDWVASP